MKFFKLTSHNKGQSLLVTLILVTGIAGAIGLSIIPPGESSVKVPEVYAPLVQTLRSSSDSRHILLQGHGTVQAHTRIDIAPQVGGRVTHVHPDFRAGGSISAGEALIRIEQSDYLLAVVESEAEVTSARTSLKLEKAEAVAAEEEWQELNPNTPIPQLVSRKPQIAQAQATVKAAEAQLAKAKLNLNRTELKMPYDGRIVSTSVGIGGIVSANQLIGEIYKSGLFEIPVPLLMEEIIWVKPSVNANIEFNVGNQSYKVNGRVERIESVLDERTRQAKAIITVTSDDIPDTFRASFIPGLFVTVSIQSQQLDHLHLLPRKVLRNDNTLWLVVDEKIQFAKPDVIHQSASNILVSAVPDDIEVITSTLDIATEGMQVRILDSK